MNIPTVIFINKIDQAGVDLQLSLIHISGIMTLLAAARALTVSIPRDGWQSIRIWEYCPLSVSRYLSLIHI